MRFENVACCALSSFVVSCASSGDGASRSGADDAGGALDGGSDAGNSGDGGAHSGGVATSGAGGRSGGAGAGSGGRGGAEPTAGGAPSGGSSAGGARASGGSGGVGSAPLIDCRTDGDEKTTLAFVNRCAESLTFEGSDIAGGSLAPGAFACVDIGSATEALSAKRYWAYAGADPGSEHHTLAEFTFNTDFNDFDWYNISHVDAFNLPMRIEPVARPNCKSLTCAEDLLAGCPDVGQLRNDSGRVVSCVSPDRDDPNSPVALYFESCEEAYAWSGDDQNGDDPSPVRACAGEDWDITFCPPG